MLLYADLKCKWNDTPKRYKILDDASQVEMAAIAAMFKVEGLRGLRPKAQTVCGDWISCFLKRWGKDKATA